MKSLKLSDNWRELIRQQMFTEAQVAGTTPDSTEREKERLKLKKTRILKQHREGYIDDEELYGELAAVELALKRLAAPEVNGLRYEEVVEAGEHLPGMAALWDVATVEERREMVMILLEPSGLYYDLENKIVAAIKPRPAFLPILRMLDGAMEFDEAKGLLVTERWQDRNRRESSSRQLHQWDTVQISFALPIKKKSPLQYPWSASRILLFHENGAPSQYDKQDEIGGIFQRVERRSCRLGYWCVSNLSNGRCNSPATFA